MSNTQNELCWLIDAKALESVDMRLTYKNDLPEDVVYRGIEDTERGLPVYNSAVSVDHDFRPIRK